MFCKNCGAKLNEGDAFCINCGAKTETPAKPEDKKSQQAFQSLSYSSEAQGPEIAPDAAESTPINSYTKSKKKTGVIAGIISGIVAVALIVVVLVVALGGGIGASSPEKAVKGFFAALQDLDFEAMVDYYAGFTLTDLEDEFDLPAGSSRKDIAKAMKEEVLTDSEAKYIMEYLKTIEIKVGKVSDTYNKTDEMFERYLDNFIDDYGFDPSDYKIECFAEVEYSIMGFTKSLLCVKIDGKWFLTDTDF